MKKILLFALLAGLAVGLVGCGENEKNEITVISREESSGTRGAFDELMKIAENGTSKLFTEAVIVSSTDEVASKVEVDKNAIGYTSLGSVNDKVKALTINGVTAKEENVKNGTYKISRPFVVAAKGAGNELAQDFIAYITSKEGQAIVVKSGYIASNNNATVYNVSGKSGKLTLSGSTSVEKVMEKLKEEYVKLNPNAKVEINYNGSSAGIKDCLENKSDIAMSSRELKIEEKAQLTDTKFALDGIAVIVNKDNALSAITTELVTKIFTGEIRNWDEVK